MVVSSETIIFNAVARWINHDKAERLVHLRHIVKHVRFPLMQHKELAKIMDHPLIKQDEISRDIILDMIHAKHFNFNHSATSDLSSKTNCTPRTPLELPKVNLLNYRNIFHIFKIVLFNYILIRSCLYLVDRLPKHRTKWKNTISNCSNGKI